MTNSGYFLHKTKPEDIQEAVWLEEQCLRRQGGYMTLKIGRASCRERV